MTICLGILNSKFAWSCFWMGRKEYTKKDSHRTQVRIEDEEITLNHCKKMAQYSHDIHLDSKSGYPCKSLKVKTYATWQRFDQLLSRQPANQQMDMRRSSPGCTCSMLSSCEVYIKAIIPWWKIQNIYLFGAAVSPTGSLYQLLKINNIWMSFQIIKKESFIFECWDEDD